MKTVDFSETIAASDLKVGRSRHLIEFLWEKVKTVDFSETIAAIDLKQMDLMEICEY